VVGGAGCRGRGESLQGVCNVMAAAVEKGVGAGFRGGVPPFSGFR